VTMKLAHLFNYKTNFVCLLKAVIIGILACQPGVLSAAPEVEVLHWWYRGGESRAMRVLKDEFEDRGGVWHNVTEESSNEVLNTAVSRMAKGYAPTLIQWNSAWEVEQIHNLGMLNNVDSSMLSNLQNTLIDNVLDMIVVDDKIIAVPVNVHSENWLWFKPEFDETLSNAVLSDWGEFLAYAQKLKSQGKVAIAVGNEPWQQRILFNNILLGIAGQEIYERIYTNLDSAAMVTDQFVEAVRVFSELKKYSQSFGDGRWDQQIAAVAANRALTVSMGDWAKGEFKNLGLRLGRDYDCVRTPGTSDNILLVMDVFVLGQVSTPEEKQGQKLFIDVVTDPDVSETFNYLKGSLSPLREINVASLDSCNQKAYNTLNKKGSAIKPYASVGDRGLLTQIDGLLALLWSENPDIGNWISEFAQVIETENKKRVVANGTLAN